MIQIRVQRAYPGRIRAGAPVPTRSMSREEVLENLRYFTEGMTGPRSRPCTRLVLSGVGVGRRPDSPELLKTARDLGMRYIVLHAGVEDLDDLDPARFAGLVDTLVVPVQPGPLGALTASARVIRACAEAGVRVVANTQLSATAVGELPAAARAIARSRPGAAAFTYPFPIAGNTASEVPGVRAVVAALARAIAELDRAGVPASVKGLPACYLGAALADRVNRSANRWYVDADHQRSEAILFFPGVVSFTKEEACRHCPADGRCDGFFATYLRRPGFPALTPLDAGG
jgi:hypothetical protein